MTSDNTKFETGGDACKKRSLRKLSVVSASSPLVLTPIGLVPREVWFEHLANSPIERRKKARKRKEQLARNAERQSSYLFNKDTKSANTFSLLPKTGAIKENNDL